MKRTQAIFVGLNGFKLINLFLCVVVVLASSGFKFLDLGLCLGFRLCYISSVPTAKHVLHFFSTWRDQTPTHRVAAVSQSLGVCRASSCSFSSSCLPQYWTTWVGVTFHDTEILNTLILYGTTSPWEGPLALQAVRGNSFSSKDCWLFHILKGGLV